MIISNMRGTVLLCAFLLSSASLILAQESNTQVKKVPIQRTSAASGAEMYTQYCAACHGSTGKGDGPAASYYKTPPADLTTLAKRHDEKYPDTYVVTVLQFGVQEAKAHGSKDMPVWGPLFGSISGQRSASATEVKLRISNLTDYLKSLQAM
jgi:mono/diheme cytochrome c family protein